MNFLFVLLVTFALGNGVSGQVPDLDPFRRSPTSFTCLGKPPGYYADLETGCKTYHVCDGVSHFTYVCPRRTLFRQSSRICDHSYLVTCGEEEPPSQDEIPIPLVETKKKLPRKEENVKDDEDLPPVETTRQEDPTEIPTTPFAKTTTAPVTTTQKPPPESSPQSIRKFLKFRLKDLRSLFFIPEIHNNSITAEPERELVLPLEKGDFMRFRPQKISHSYSACPGYCNPKFFLPGTCHPCIFIK